MHPAFQDLLFGHFTMIFPQELITLSHLLNFNLVTLGLLLTSVIVTRLCHPLNISRERLRTALVEVHARGFIKKILIMLDVLFYSSTRIIIKIIIASSLTATLDSHPKRYEYKPIHFCLWICNKPINIKANKAIHTVTVQIEI